MSLKSYLTNLFIQIDTSEKTDFVIGFFQAIIGVSVIFYTCYKDSQIYVANVFLFISVVVYILIILYYVIMVFYSRTYRAIKLRLNRNTGVLSDRTTNFRNISLRHNTLKIILKGMEDSNKTYEVGKEAGKDFYKSFDEELQRKEKNYSIEDKLKKWLEYDSSSGLGKFEASTYNKSFTLELKISSPFAGHCPGPHNPNPGCCFLMGYIDGFCSMLFEKDLKSRCEHSIDPSYCTIKVMEVG